MPGRWRVGTTRIQGVVVDACWRPADDRHSGDFHDVIDLHDGRVAVVVGDVAGKGLHASIHAERLTAVVRRRLREDADLSTVLSELDAVTVDAGDEMIATMVTAVIEPSSRRVLIMNAGHLPLVVADLGGGRALDSIANPPIGVPAKRSVVEHPLDRDAALFSATDGLLERRGASLDGMHVFVSACREGAVATSSAVEVAARVTAQLGQPSDDATVLSVRLLDAPAPLFV